MEKELNYLLGMMSDEIFYEWAEIAYEQIHDPFPKFKELQPDFPERVKAQFASLLKARYLSVADYAALTGIEFADDDSMYSFLAEVYEYLFESKGSDNPPYPIID